MRALICVFSGTGNTLRVCERLAEELRGRGVDADIYSIREGADLPEAAGYDRLIVGYPVHAFNAPLPVLRFLRRLPQGGGTPAYLVRTSGEPLRYNHASGITPRRLLVKKGYAVKADYAYVMPYNIIFRHSDGMAARMWRSVGLRIGADAGQVAEGTGERTRVGPLCRIASFVLRIEHPGMHLIGRHFRATERCVGCGTCARLCPQKNITMAEGRPKFGKSCAGCMSCAFNCPKDAVRTGILNGWRVNGAYTLDGVPAGDDEVCSYCRKSYLRYFHEVEAGSGSRAHRR